MLKLYDNCRPTYPCKCRINTNSKQYVNKQVLPLSTNEGMKMRTHKFNNRFIIIQVSYKQTVNTRVQAATIGFQSLRHSLHLYTGLHTKHSYRVAETVQSGSLYTHTVRMLTISWRNAVKHSSLFSSRTRTLANGH